MSHRRPETQRLEFGNQAIGDGGESHSKKVLSSSKRNYRKLNVSKAFPNILISYDK
jgi:hypothetical protein